MREHARQQLLAQIKATGASAPAAKQGTPADVRVGQVRKLRAYDDHLDSMLVVVVGVDATNATATVVVASSPADQATNRDLVLHRDWTGFAFDTVVMVDVIAKVWLTQLDRTATVGSVSDQVADLASNAHRFSAEELAAKAIEVGAAIGELDPHVGDHMWWLRGQIAEHMARLSDSCHQASLAPIVADPAILPALIARGDTADLEATLALIDAKESDDVIVTEETLMCSATMLSRTHTNPDVLRLIQFHFMDSALRANIDDHRPYDDSAEMPQVLPNREVPEGLGGDPLVGLVAKSIGTGEACTRIWTSPHLWHADDGVSHLLINGVRHPLVTEYNDRVKEIS